jgi:hypothetical protein
MRPPKASRTRANTSRSATRYASLCGSVGARPPCQASTTARPADSAIRKMRCRSGGALATSPWMRAWAFSKMRGTLPKRVGRTSLSSSSTAGTLVA